MTVVSAESRANWERLQNRRKAKLLSLEDATRLIANNFRLKQQHWSVSWKPPVGKKLPGKRARESGSEEDPNKKRMRVHLDLLKEYEQGEKQVNKIKEEVRSFFDSAVVPKHSAIKLVKVETPPEDDIILPKLRSLPLTRDTNRDRFRELLAEALNKVSGEVRDSLKIQVGKCDPFRVAAEVESALYLKWGSFSGAQESKYRSIMFNMRDPKNPDFRRKALLGVYPPKVFPQLTSELMASDERRSENEKIKEELNWRF